MSKRKIIAIVAGVLLLILIIVGVWWIISQRQSQVILDNQADNGQLPPKLPILPAGTNGINGQSAVVSIQDKQTESTVRALAKTFAERFGSYSNQGNFEHLADLRDLMTVKMKGWADNYVAAQKAQATSNVNYYGVTTIALSVAVTSFEEELGRAELTVSTQRQETKGTAASTPRVFYQDLLVKMVKTNEGWKVDEVTWQ